MAKKRADWLRMNPCIDFLRGSSQLLVFCLKFRESAAHWFQYLRQFPLRVARSNVLWAIPVESLDMDHKRALDRRLLFGHSESLDERLGFSVFFVNLGSPRIFNRLWFG